MKTARNSGPRSGRAFVALGLMLAIWCAGCASTPPGGGRAHGLVATLSDYGSMGFYSGALVGATLRTNPAARVVTITNEIAAYNVAQGAYVLAEAAEEFPPGTVFLCAVTPGAGGRAVAVRTRNGQTFLAPDNGLLTHVMDRFGVAESRAVTNQALLVRKQASPIFLGRDVLAPVAGRLSAGLPLSRVGPPAGELKRLLVTKPAIRGAKLIGQVVYVDRYGNLLTNIPGKLIRDVGAKLGEPWNIAIGARTEKAAFSKQYSDVPKGAWLFLINAEDSVEIARNMTSAAEGVSAVEGASVALTP